MRFSHTFSKTIPWVLSLFYIQNVYSLVFKRMILCISVLLHKNIGEALGFVQTENLRRQLRYKVQIERHREQQVVKK